jgi:DNA-binding MarR family transcriptional regulator
MSLEHELGLRTPVALLGHEALLNIYFTATCIKKRAAEFLRRFGLTDVQLNVLMLLHHQSGAEGGLSQAEISDMMLVNRANITSLVDRMEKAKLVVRTAAANDRRFNIVKLTDKAKKLFAKVDPLYSKEVKSAMAVLKGTEQKKLIKMLERVRANITG